MGSPPSDFEQVPVIDVRALVAPASTSAERQAVAERMGAACRQNGFFYVVGHGVDEALQTRLETLSRRFFALSEERKLAIRMARGGAAWRGYFPVGGELTSGRPDRKEGLYFGTELTEGHMTSRGVISCGRHSANRRLEAACCDFSSESGIYSM